MCYSHSFYVKFRDGRDGKEQQTAALTSVLDTGAPVLGDHVTVYFVLCLVSLAIGLTAQGWKHRTIWRHKMLAQPWRAPRRDRWLSESSFIGGDTWERCRSARRSQSRLSFGTIAETFYETLKYQQESHALPRAVRGRVE